MRDHMIPLANSEQKLLRSPALKYVSESGTCIFYSDLFLDPAEAQSLQSSADKQQNPAHSSHSYQKGIRRRVQDKTLSVKDRSKPISFSHHDKYTRTKSHLSISHQENRDFGNDVFHDDSASVYVSPKARAQQSLPKSVPLPPGQARDGHTQLLANCGRTAPHLLIQESKNSVNLLHSSQIVTADERKAHYLKLADLNALYTRRQNLDISERPMTIDVRSVLANAKKHEELQAGTLSLSSRLSERSNLRS